MNLRVTDVWKNYMTVSWEAPEIDGGSPIISYSIEQKDSKDRTYTFVVSLDAKTTSFQVRTKHIQL